MRKRIFTPRQTILLSLYKCRRAQQLTMSVIVKIAITFPLQAGVTLAVKRFPRGSSCGKNSRAARAHLKRLYSHESSNSASRGGKKSSNRKYSCCRGSFSYSRLWGYSRLCRTMAKTIKVFDGTEVEYVEVRDEPIHRHQFNNEYVYVYIVGFRQVDSLEDHWSSLIYNNICLNHSDSRFTSQ